MHDLIHLFLRDLRNAPRFTKEQEQQLARKARDGDTEARNQLVLSCIPFAIEYASTHYYPQQEDPEWYQEAAVGVLDAVQKFDVEKDFRLITYVGWRVRKRLQRVIEKERREARLISEYAEHRVKRYYNPVEECEIEEEFRMLEDLKNSLPEEIRLIFFDWVNGKTYKEIGEEKGITKQAIQLRCEKGVWLMRKAYRKRLGKLVGKIDGKT